MRIRNLLLSSVMCGGVALMSSAAWSQTAPKVTYKPQGDWAVTRMAAKGAGKAPYCTMARRFGNNTILTFARNANGETSVAMDFQPKTLAKGQSYYVTLDPGASEKRAFDVTPVSDKAMVIRLGSDTKFHDALNQSGVLNVDVAGLQFEFNLPDMEKGSQDLSGCVTSIVEPAAGEAASKPSSKSVALAQADTAAPITRRASDDILAAPITNKPMANAPTPILHKDVPPAAVAIVTPPPAAIAASGNSEAESLREENLRLKNALERERREYEDRFMRESSGSSQVSEVMEKLKLLEKENSDLKYQLADARSMAPKAAVVSKADASVPSCAPADPKLGAEMSTLRDENARLKADIAAQKTAMVQLEMQAGQAKAAGGKVAAEGGVVARLQSRIEELSTQNSKLQSDLMSAQASAATASTVSADGSISISQLRSVEAQLKFVEKERDSLRSQIDKMGEGQENGLLKLSGSDWNLEQATRRYNEAEREIRRLGSQLEQARTQCSVEKKEIEYMLFDPEIATQQQISKLMTLETEVNASKDALAKKDSELAKRDGEINTRIMDYEQKISKLESEGNKSKAAEAELAALRNELSVAKQSAAEQISIAQRRAQDAAAEAAIAQRQAQETAAAQVAAAQQRAQEESSAAQKRALEEAAVAQKRANDQIAALQGQIQVEKSAVANDMNAQIAKVNAEKDQMAQRIALLESEKTKMQNAEGERLALKERVSALESEKLQLEARAVAAVQPAAGTPRVAVQEMEVAAVSAVSPQAVSPHAVQAEPIGAPVSLRPGQVSSRVEPPAAVALAPKSAIPADTFQPTQAVVAPVVQALAPAAAPVTAPVAVAPSSNLITADALSGQLRQAGLALTGNVKKVDNVSGPSSVAYSWDASGLFGSAEQKQMANAEQFQTLVNQYLDKTKSRCAGDFAASPVPTMPAAGVQIASYEIACISPDGNGATAALAFYGKNGLFTTVAHEASMDTMDLAMDARDRVLASVMK